MRIYYIVPFFIISLGAISGCSSISKEECLLGDWHQIGLSDGQNGKRNNASSYNKDCSEYQVQVDVKLYNDGRSTGLKSFCTYENGVFLGSSNQGYNKVCSPELSSAFLSGYTPYHNFARAQESQRRSESDVKRNIELLEDKNISNNEIKTLKKSIKLAKLRLDDANGNVSRYRKALTLHKIQVEKSNITKELSNNNLPNSQKMQLNKRLDTLKKQQSFYENLSQAEETIRSIKGVADLF